MRQHFGEEAFDSEVIAHGRTFDFTKELQSEPKKRAACDVVARSVQHGGAVGEAFLPRRANLDFVKANAAGADFVLMRDARRTEHQSEWSILTFAATDALAVMAVEDESKEGKLMRVARKLAGRRVAHVAKNGSALLAGAVDGAEEVSGTHVGSWRREGGGNIWVGSSVRHKGTSRRGVVFILDGRNGRSLP